jgi:hypothetical protein
MASTIGVVAVAERLAGQVGPTSTPARKTCPPAHLVQPPVEVLLLHLELGDAVAQQPADLVGRS